MENFAGAQERIGSPYRFGRSRHWVKSKNPAAPAVKREAEEDEMTNRKLEDHRP